ncbi:MAG: adenosine deaminase [Planctomycetes bacterium]|nr:adenosine deaminase [Planctomycetota bacterium]
MKRALLPLLLLLALPLAQAQIAPTLDPNAVTPPKPIAIAPLTSAGEATQALYAKLREQSDPEELNLFLRQMPKGADLHHHYSGSFYAETYLEWAKEQEVKINPETLKLEGYKQDPDAVTIDEFLAGPDNLERLIKAWSVAGYDPEAKDAPSPDKAFFDTFVYFGGFATKTYDKGFKLLRERARDENVLYVETLLSGVPFYLPSRGSKAQAALKKANEDLWNASDAELPKVLERLAKGWEKSKAFEKAVSGFVEELEQSHEGIDTDDFLLRYHSYAIREKPPVNVYSGLVAAFAAAERCDLIVAVNLVGLENGEQALRDYRLHMRMMQFLSARYPKVNVALHAGEITPALVEAEDIGFHVREAIEVAGARRIGHGIDLLRDPDPEGLMKLMIERGIPVEINLTSNEFILGVAGPEHPYGTFRDAGVPMVLSTDDQGVVRNDIVSEYALLATRHEADYAQLKRLVYNNVRFAFLDDATKDRLKDALDARFADFERAMADYAEAKASATPDPKPAGGPADLQLGDEPK